MHIINLLDRETQNIQAAVLAMVGSEDRLQAAKGQRFLELVKHLQSQGPAPTACGLIVLDELWLTPANRANRASVRVWVDWLDNGPLRDGLPAMHYRLQAERPGASLSRDTRAKTPEEASQAIFEAFG